MRALSLVGVCALALSASACGDDDGTTDIDAGASPDASIPTDAGSSDAGPGCIPVRVSTWELEGLDDVSVAYRAQLLPAIGGEIYDLAIQFLRYGDATYVGTFDLGSGVDANHSTCAHCVAAWNGMDYSRGFFVAEGELELDADPFEMTWSGALRGARLIEVTIEGETLMSVPVEDGRCIVVEDTSFDRRYAPTEWTCADEAYGDGATCDCGCGPVDPDCDDPSRPVAGCDPGEACLGLPSPLIVRIDGVCVERCDRASGDACEEGVCTFGPTGVDYCVTSPTAWDADAAIGDTCDEGASLCAVDEGRFVRGLCDVWDRNDLRCRPTCDEQSDCDAGAFERCFTITGGLEEGEGFCSPRYPAAWTCTGDRYEDGTYCDCACGAVDPDCVDPEADVRGCEAGERCVYDATCAAIPANDTCTGAIPLSFGTTISGTTRGAGADYTVASPCVVSEQQGPDVAYSVELAAGQTLAVTATPAEHDLALALLGPGACEATARACVAGVDAARRGEAETLTFTATTAGVYHVIVDSFWAEELGAFTLTATLTP